MLNNITWETTNHAHLWKVAAAEEEAVLRAYNLGAGKREGGS
jgi:hypothetical protein